jgi:hypothetical protein
VYEKYYNAIVYEPVVAHGAGLTHFCARAPYYFTVWGPFFKKKNEDKPAGDFFFIKTHSFCVFIRLVFCGISIF